VDENAVLEISYVGFETQLVSLQGKSALAISLNPKNNSLDEMQIIAYGTTTKRLNTGNVSTVKARDIETQPINNPLLALEGRVPGLFITQSSGLAGSGVKVKIQGQNSIGRGSDPLYVIDGVPYTSETLPTLSSILGLSGTSAGGTIPIGSGNPLSFINPADIESIDVLKDADATAIYGSRAAAGAILITTKKGKAGQTKVNISLQNGWGKVARKLNLLNTQQYLEMRHEALRNDNLTPSATDYDINGVWDTTRYTDWQKELLGGTSKFQDVQASVSGGNSNVQYLIGGGYHKETTVFPGDFADQKGSMHFSINSISPNQRFKVQLSGNYLVDKNQLPTNDLTQQALRLAPDAPMLYNSDGSLNWALLSNGNSSFNNPIGNYAYSKYQDKTNNLIANALVSYKIITGLELKASFGFTRLENDEIQTSPFAAIAPPNWPFSQRTTQFGHGLINSWILEPQATYSHKFGKGQLQTLVGTTFQEQNSNLQQVTATGFNSDLVMEDIKSASSITPYATVIANYKYSALFGRVNYNWTDKYILNLTGRRDGSSRFGSENLFHNFWSMAGGWIFSSEKFMQSNLAFISFGKLRASYGTTGNDQIGDYQFLNQYSTISNVQVAYQGINSIAPQGIPNPYIQWEETRKLQFGLDFGFLKDRILLSANYSRNRSSNQLLSYSLPITTGVGSLITNFPATIENTAWEFSVNTDNVHSGNFKWTSNFNLSIPKNKLVAFPNIETSSYSSSLIVGQPFTIKLLYHFIGVDPTTGAYVFSDSKGNVTSKPQYPTDATAVVNMAPKFYGGFQNRISYKGFALDFLFQFVKQIGTNYAFGFQPGRFNLNQPDYVLSRWTKPGDVTTIQRYYSNSSLSSAYTNLTSISDGVWADASYIRLKNLSLSWQLPQATLQKLHLKNLRVYTQGQNLLTITNYKGLDPENLSTSSLPMLRVITVGLQLTL
jgi:TonB-linked SusC/RagA family outer membrane protein